MKYYYLTNLILIFFLFISLTACSQTNKKNDYLISFTDTIKDESGYKNQKGDIIIPPGKYRICFTDTFKTYAIVLKSGAGFLAIDRQENILYQVFPFDNGPDYTSDGLFRILENNKIGYADSFSGKIVINPRFSCAFPFVNGKAKVSDDCKEKSDGEHNIWLSDNWYYIDKTGKKINRPNKE